MLEIIDQTSCIRIWFTDGALNLMDRNGYYVTIPLPDGWKLVDGRPEFVRENA